MPSTSATSRSIPRSHRASARRSTVLALLLVCLSCPGLAACGSTAGGATSATKSAEANTTTNVAASEGGARSPAGSRKIAELRKVLRCIRAHGVAVPEVSAAGNIDMRRVNQYAKPYQIALQSCLQKLKPEAHLRQSARRENSTR